MNAIKILSLVGKIAGVIAGLMKPHMKKSEVMIANDAR